MLSLAVFTVFSALYLRKHKSELGDQSFTNRFGSLYTNIEIDKNGAIYYTCVNLTRRFLIAAAIGFAYHSIVLQIFCIVHVGLIVAAFTVSVGPMVEDIEDFMTSQNEIMILFFSQYIFLFSSFVTDPEVSQLFGSIYLGLLGLALAVNIIVVIYMAVTAFLYVRKLKKARKLYQEQKQKKDLKKQEFLKKKKAFEKGARVEIANLITKGLTKEERR